MKKTAIVLGLWTGLLGACASEQDEVTALPEGRGKVEVGLTEVPSAEKSLLLFFRKYETGDTLAFIREIAGPRKDFESFTVEVPVGYYQLVLIGNGDREHIRLGNPASVNNSAVIYEGGIEPPDLYLGKIMVNVGEQEKVAAAFVILSCRIALTIHDTPANVTHMEVDLKNTSSGVTFNVEALNQPTDPCISKSLYVTEGSSPVLNFRCLSTVPAPDSSFLEVRCYDSLDRLVYRGSSGKLFLRGSEDIKLGCSFASQEMVKASELTEIKAGQFTLYPESGQK